MSKILKRWRHESDTKTKLASCWRNPSTYVNSKMASLWGFRRERRYLYLRCLLRLLVSTLAGHTQCRSLIRMLSSGVSSVAKSSSISKIWKSRIDQSHRLEIAIFTSQRTRSFCSFQRWPAHSHRYSLLVSRRFASHRWVCACHCNPHFVRAAGWVFGATWVYSLRTYAEARPRAVRRQREWNKRFWERW